MWVSRSQGNVSVVEGPTRNLSWLKLSFLVRYSSWVQSSHMSSPLLLMSGRKETHERGAQWNLLQGKDLGARGAIKDLSFGPGLGRSPGLSTASLLLPKRGWMEASMQEPWPWSSFFNFQWTEVLDSGKSCEGEGGWLHIHRVLRGSQGPTPSFLQDRIWGPERPGLLPRATQIDSSVWSLSAFIRRREGGVRWDHSCENIRWDSKKLKPGPPTYPLMALERQPPTFPVPVWHTYENYISQEWRGLKIQIGCHMPGISILIIDKIADVLF